MFKDPVSRVSKHMRNHPLCERRQRGFTLVELMVVIIILGLLATVVAPNVIKHLGDAEITKAKEDIRQIQAGVKMYFMKNHKIPKLEDLTTPDKSGDAYVEGFEHGGTPKDPWGNPYVIREGDKPGKFEVISFGKDMQEGTEDDINSTKIASEAGDGK